MARHKFTAKDRAKAKRVRKMHKLRLADRRQRIYRKKYRERSYSSR